VELESDGLYKETQMKKLPIMVLACAASACFTCAIPDEDHPSDKTLTEAPLPSRIVDLSPLVTEDLPLRTWGKKMLTDWGFALRNEFEDVGAEDPLYVVNSYWTLSNHAGAHLDAPNHMEKGARSIDQYSLDELIGRARLLDFRMSPADEPISLKEIEQTEIQAGEIALLIVGYSPPVGADELPSYPYLSREAAEYLASLPVKAIGTDAFSVESVARVYEAIEQGATGYEGVAPLHRVFLGRDMPVFEQLENLEELIGLEKVVFVGFPLKVEGSNGSPIRAAALVY
jgi:kynurenine formamidase